MNYMVPRNVLVKQGTKAVGGLGSGAALLILRSIANFGAGLSIPGLIIGGVLTVIGLGTTSSKSDRPTGLLVTGAGILTAAASLPIIGGLAGFLMGAAGVGLLIGGGISLYKFIKGLKSRK
ncbi:MAG: hypothetical protein ACLFST_01640 [Spirochaetia bacterium]